MKKVLVTGANGFVGNHLVKELSSHGIKVVGVGGELGTKKKPDHIDEYMVLDLNDFNAASKIDFRNISGVIHLAGLAAVGPSFNFPMEYITTNIGIQTNLFEAAMVQKAKPKFLIISSGSLYSPMDPLPLTEKSAISPSSSPYAISKVGQEQMAYYYNQRGFSCIIARPFNHIGPGQNPGFIVPDLTKQVVEFERAGAKKVSVGNLDAKRDYTDVRDIVRAYRLLLTGGNSGEIYNICSGKALSGHQILAAILKASGSKPTIVEDPDRLRPSDAPALYGSHKKLTNDTGWEPEIPFETTIRDVVEDWRQRD